ncbi:hypothetical protein EJ07DRAFT_151771 [Lizonia empirigonia]|nr:hypothetical protein EJ07DRAFT_151771 [Lizonia empirigonia]
MDAPIEHGHSGYGLLCDTHLKTLAQEREGADCSFQGLVVRSTGSYDDIVFDHCPICMFPWVHNRFPRINDDNSPPHFNQTAQQDDRMHYANLKFNARHDSRVSCEEKIVVVKEKMGLFREEGIELDDDDLERASDREGADHGMKEDEDEDKQRVKSKTRRMDITGRVPR